MNSQENVKWHQRVIPPEQIIRRAPHAACLSLMLGFLLLLWHPVAVSEERIFAGLFLVIGWLWLVVVPWSMRRKIRHRNRQLP